MLDSGKRCANCSDLFKQKDTLHPEFTIDALSHVTSANPDVNSLPRQMYLHELCRERAMELYCEVVYDEERQCYRVADIKTAKMMSPFRDVARPQDIINELYNLAKVQVFFGEKYIMAIHFTYNDGRVRKIGNQEKVPASHIKTVTIAEDEQFIGIVNRYKLEGGSPSSTEYSLGDARTLLGVTWWKCRYPKINVPAPQRL